MERMMSERKISTKKEIHQAFEDILNRRGPQTCKGLVETLQNEYHVSRVQIDSDRASQYLRQNPNITILGDVYLNGNVHLYGLKNVDYDLESFNMVAGVGA